MEISVKYVCFSNYNDILEIKINSTVSNENFITCILSNNVELIQGELIKKIKMNARIYSYFYWFHLSNRNSFFSSILKIMLDSGSAYENDEIKYYILYSDDVWEEYIDDYELMEKYFNSVDNQENINNVYDAYIEGLCSNYKIEDPYFILDDELSLEDFSFLYIDDSNDDIVEDDDENEEEFETNTSDYSYYEETNGYDISWLRMTLSDWDLNFTLNSENLYIKLKLMYQGCSGNVLDDLQLYVTSCNGNNIQPYGYISDYGEIPRRIDIWNDNELHNLCLAPVFPIKEDSKYIEPGMRFTFSYKDLRNKYYIRKTYIYNGYIFGDEELFAYPLK